MCVAFPMQIVSIDDERHGVVQADGVERRVNLRLLPGCRPGDFVLVHAGYAIERVSPELAGQNRELFRKLSEAVSS